MSTRAQALLNFAELYGFTHTAAAARRIVEREQSEAGAAAQTNAAIPCDLFAPPMPGHSPAPQKPENGHWSEGVEGYIAENWEWPSGMPLVTGGSLRDIEPEGAHWDRQAEYLAADNAVYATMLGALPFPARATMKHNYIHLEGTRRQEAACT